MPLYESVIVTRQDITKTQVEKLAQQFCKLIEDQGGNIKRTEYWGLKGLAYEINKNKKGHYMMLILDTKANTIAEYERKLSIDEDVIRFVTMKIKTYNENPSIMMKNVEENYNDKEKELVKSPKS